MLISDKFREDFWDLMPSFNGVSIIDKSLVPVSDELELDSCLYSCGGLCGTQFYSTFFTHILVRERPIAKFREAQYSDSLACLGWKVDRAQTANFV